MKCPQAHRLMMAWLDSELETSATVEVSEHLETCAPCRRRFAAEERLERGMAALLRDESMPTDVWQRLTAGLDVSRPSRWRWVAAAAALVLCLGLALHLTPQPNGLLTEMARSHHALVSGAAPLDLYTSQAAELHEFLAARRLDALVPELPGLVDHHQMELLGVREERLLGQAGVAVAVRCCGVPATLFLMRRERVDALPDEWRKAASTGTWRDGDLQARVQLGDEQLLSVVWEGGHAPPSVGDLARL